MIRTDELGRNWADWTEDLGKIRADWTEDLGKIGRVQSAQRAELTAITNRHVWVEETIETAERGQAFLKQKQAFFEEKQAALEEQIRRHNDNHKVFLSWTQGGLFPSKEGELISELASREGSWDGHILWVARQAAEVFRERNGGQSSGRAVDAGAHFGLVSIPLARMFDCVFSFEPNEFNVTLLRANAAINGVADRINVRRAALFSRDTRLSLAPSDHQKFHCRLIVTAK